MTVFERFAASMAFENKISCEVAEKITAWLGTEGVLDYTIINETYPDTQPVFEEVALAANDA